MVKEMPFKITPTPPKILLREKRATDKLELRQAHLINSRLLYEARSVGGQQSVCGHDVNLIGSSFFQDLCSCDKVSNIVYDVILGGGEDRTYFNLLCFKSAWER